MCGLDPQRASTDAWDNAEAYESYVGRWSRLVALEFLAWLEFPPDRRWLDVGCGAGALSRTILDAAQPETSLGIDPSEHYVNAARKRIADPHAQFEIGDARTLPVADEASDAVVSGLVLNFLPEPDRPAAIAEMLRAVREGGVVAAYVWDYAEGMQLMRHFWVVAAALDPAAAELDEGRRFSFCQPGPLAVLFRNNGLFDVQVRAIEVPTVFRDFDDYWTPFLGGQGTAPGYTMSLDEEQRGVLRERLRLRLPVMPDGSISLTARAWAVRGRRLSS